MLFLRLVFVFAFVILATPDANAQLFRFRNQAQRLPPQAASRYDARSYQYNVVQQPQAVVPSQRYAVLPQTPNCNRQQTAANGANVIAQQSTPTIVARQQQLAQQQAVANQQAAVRNQQQAVANQQRAALERQRAIAANQQRSVLEQQQVAAARQAASPQQVTVLQRPSNSLMQQPQVQNQSSSRVVMMTFRDARTGQLFQRPYLVPNTAQTAVIQQPQPRPADVVAPIAVSAEPAAVAQTSFESPILDPAKDNNLQEFSVFDQGAQVTPVGNAGSSVIQDSLPELELEFDTTPAADAELNTSTGLDLELDLSPLNPQADE